MGFYSSKCTKTRFQPGIRSGLSWGSSQRSPRLPSRPEKGASRSRRLRCMPRFSVLTHSFSSANCHTVWKPINIADKHQTGAVIVWGGSGRAQTPKLWGRSGAQTPKRWPVPRRRDADVHEILVYGQKTMGQPNIFAKNSLPSCHRPLPNTHNNNPVYIDIYSDFNKRPLIILHKNRTESKQRKHKQTIYSLGLYAVVEKCYVHNTKERRIFSIIAHCIIYVA